MALRLVILSCLALLAADAAARPNPAKLTARLLAANEHIRRSDPAAFQRKLGTKMRASPFAYFRGTASLLDRRLRKQDRDRPEVLGNGDVHPLNFGVLRSASGELRFVANDQDEARRAPYTRDLKRGGVGFELMAAEQGLSGEKRTRIVEAFVDAYLAGVDRVARGERSRPKPPGLIRDLLALASDAQAHPERFYSAYLNADGTFIQRDRYTPVRVDRELRQTYATYLGNLRGERPAVARELSGYRLTGAAIKETNGVGSMGLKRLVLALRRTDGRGTPLLLELKEQRVASPASEGQAVDPARRVHDARVLQTGGGERFDGHTTRGGVSYQVMTLGPHQLDISDLGKPRLGNKEMRELARACGAALAEAHLQLGAAPAAASRALARQILADARGGKMDSEISRFARKAATRINAEHGTFLELLGRGAFGF